MNCIQCNGKMKFSKQTKTSHQTQNGKYRIKIFKCVDCDYTETVYGNTGIDSQLINKFND